MNDQPQHHKPPKMAECILRWILPDGTWDTPLGDFEEFYNAMAREESLFEANTWYWRQIARLIPAKILNSIYWSVQMFKNYLKVALRVLRRHKGFSFINIAGLAIGMACCILIFLWVQDEISFDQFHENGKNLNIVGTRMRLGSEIRASTGTPPALGPALKADYPEIVNSVRICNGPHTLYLAFGDEKFEEKAEAVDPSFLEMFTFPLKLGDSSTALSNPHSLVMTAQMAEKYFGIENPLGKVIRVDNAYDFKVTGVLEKIPHNSTFQFDFLIPIEFLKERWSNPRHLETWYNLSFTTFVQLQENTSLEEFNSKIVDRITREYPKDDVKPFLWPYEKYYLHGLGTGGGHIQQIRVLSLIALFVLIIACVNFMNLTTARSGTRAKEIGMRKVTGAAKVDIIKQFFGECVLLSSFSLFLAIALVLVLLPFFNNLTGKELTFDLLGNPFLIFGLLGASLFTGFMAGSYPALMMSSFEPVRIFRFTGSAAVKKSTLRKVLVVFQFAITITLIIWAVVVYDQLQYMRSKDLGFSKDHLIYIPVNGALKQQYEAAKQELLKVPGVTDVSVTSRTPLSFGSSGSNWQWEGKSEDTNPMIRYFCCDYDFPQTFQIAMAKGRFFSKELTPSASPRCGQVVINEEFARIIGEDDPVGMRLIKDGRQATIIGVIKDFNYWPLYWHSGPLIVFYKSYNFTPHFFRYIFARVGPEDVSRAIEGIKQVYARFNPEFPFIYRFLDDDYAKLYISEERTASIIKNFSIMAIVVSCLGLLGLASFLTEQRTKEIGIRKVLGSSVKGIVLLLSKDFVKWVALANLIAWPIAWYTSTKWLENYAYRTTMHVGMLLFAGFLALAIALLTISYQSIKAATANPADSLRYE